MHKNIKYNFMPLIYATRKRIKEHVDYYKKLFGFTNAQFIEETDKAIANLSTDEETGEVSKEYIEASKNQIHFHKKVKKYLISLS